MEELAHIFALRGDTDPEGGMELHSNAFIWGVS
jgi:hypothetical protein